MIGLRVRINPVTLNLISFNSSKISVLTAGGCTPSLSPPPTVRLRESGVARAYIRARTQTYK